MSLPTFVECIKSIFGDQQYHPTVGRGSNDSQIDFNVATIDVFHSNEGNAVAKS